MAYNGRSYTLTDLTQYFHGWLVGGVSRCKKETLIKIKKMIQIGNLVINEKEFNSIDLDNVYKKLSKLDSKYLSEVIIDLSEKLYNLQKINSVFHAEMMSNKKSIGGVTVDI